MTRHERKQLGVAYYELLAALDKVAEILATADDEHAAEDKVNTALDNSSQGAADDKRPV